MACFRPSNAYLHFHPGTIQYKSSWPVISKCSMSANETLEFNDLDPVGTNEQDDDYEAE